MVDALSNLELILKGVFDYAGMYPPASLSLDDALKTAAAFDQSLKRPYLVANDLVLDRKNLSAVDGARLEAAGFKKDKTVRICFLGSTPDEMDASLPAEYEFIKTFNAKQSGGVSARITSYEIKIPKQAIEYRDLLYRSLRGLRTSLAGSDVMIFVEPDLSGPDYLTAVQALSAAFRELNFGGGPQAGLKVRGSGPTAVDNERLSFIIETVSRTGVPFKATAGMHHPIIEKDRYQNTLGFLNCLVALCLSRILGQKKFTRDNILECLNNSAADAFKFDSGISWKAFSISPEQAAKAKSIHFSVGSCSLAEPDQDLARLFSQARS